MAGTSWRNQFVYNLNSRTTMIDGYGSTSDSVGTFVNATLAGAVCTRSGVGQYDLLLDTPYSQFLSFAVTQHSQNVRSGLKAEILWHNVLGSVDVFGHAAQTIRFAFLNGSTPTELPANSGFDILLLVKDSPNKPGS